MLIDADDIGPQVAETIMDGLAESNAVGVLLVSQAQRRMYAGGDSQFTYPDLWGNQWSYRAGGQPLLDTGQSARSLHGESERFASGLRVRLMGPLHMVYHQHGFATKGPNYIPLTNKGKFHVNGRNPLEEGLVQLMPGGSRRKLDEFGRKVETDDAPDFLMAWKGVDVPQRKVFNMPPEDSDEIRETVRLVMMR